MGDNRSRGGYFRSPRFNCHLWAANETIQKILTCVVSLPVISILGTFRVSAPIGNVAPVWDGCIKCVIKES